MPDASDRWQPLAAQLRADSIRATTAAGSGHPTSSLSAADLMAVLLQDHLHYDWKTPRDPDNDRLVFSKGHASPLLYAMFKAAGAITDEELLSLRKRGSRLEGHPTPALPWVDVATGSLGQGLPAAVGMALAARHLRRDIRCWVLLGDSEMAEGSVYEAFELAGFYGLAQVIAIIDMNRLGQRGPTMVQWDGEQYAARARAFGWNALLLDGHDREAIDRAYGEAERSPRPTCLVARTVKGAGVSFLADREGWHGRALSGPDAARALAELGQPRGDLVVETPAPRRTSPPVEAPASGSFELPHYAVGAKVATREAFGDALAKLGASDPDVVALDGEVGNSTYSERFQKTAPERFYEIYIAEQQLVSAAVGMQVLGLTPFAATFAAFFSRAHDQLRMAAISRAHLCLVGSHAGVSIGEDGPSQMALEDLAMMRALHGSTVLYPSCATTAAALTREMASRPGISYLRTTREKTPVLYRPDEPFEIGGSKVLRRSSRDVAAVLAAGITLHEALAAHDQLREEGIAVRVVDLYSVKPIDAATVEACARECQGRLVVVEDHWPEGGLGDAVSEVFDGRADPPSLTRLAVRGMPGSGTPRELLDAAGIGARRIVETVRRLAGETAHPRPAPPAGRRASNPLRELERYGQSIWYDSLRRGILASGELARYVEEDGLKGLTTNPAIYEKAIGETRDYEAELATLLPRADLDAAQIYEALAVHDIQAAADLLRPVYDRASRRDGYVSLEVSPLAARDERVTLAEARRLWRAVGRENVMIKVPGTFEAVPAIQRLLAEGVNVNVTLLFSREAYRRVAEAHLAALEERARRGEDLTRIGSVASFFVSRIDAAVDRRLDAIATSEVPEGTRGRARALRGRIAIANAKLAYQDWRALVATPRWAALREAGAMPQRLLWASTSTKDPRYRDVMYVEELIGPETVDTVPPATFAAFRDHGHVAATLEADLDGARAAIAELGALGVSLDEVTAELLDEGVRLFSEPFAKLLSTIEARRAAAGEKGAGAPH